MRGQLTSLANKLAVRPTKEKVKAILPATMPLLPTPLISRVSTVLLLWIQPLGGGDDSGIGFLEAAAEGGCHLSC